MKGTQNGVQTDLAGDLSTELLALMMGSRLTEELRGRNGFIYTAECNYTEWPEEFFYVSTSFHPSKLMAVKDLVRRTEDSLASSVPDAEFETQRSKLMELTRVKYRSGTHPIQEHINRRLGLRENFQDAMRTLEELVPNDVRKIARHIFSQPYSQASLGRMESIS